MRGVESDLRDGDLRSAGRDIEGEFSDVLHVDAAGVDPLFALLFIQPAVQVGGQSAVI